MNIFPKHRTPNLYGTLTKVTPTTMYGTVGTP